MEVEARPTAQADPAEIQEVLPYLWRVSARSPVRRLAEAYLSDGIGALQNLSPLIESLASPRWRTWRERVVAAWLLGRPEMPRQLRFQAASALFETLTEANMAWGVTGRAAGSAYRVSAAGCLSLVAIIALLRLMMAPGLGAAAEVVILGGFTGLALAVPFAFFIAPIVMPIAAAADNRVRATAAAGLGRLRYPTATGALAHAVHDSSSAVRDEALHGLTATTAALTPSYYGRSGPGTIRELLRLAWHWDDSLALLALGTLGRVGDGSCVAPIKRLTRSHQPVIRAAAERILPILEERKRLETDPQRLLRPAVSPESLDEILLRPITDSDSDPHQLLRPVNSSTEAPSQT